ncbi:MAG: hypothetical protein ACP5U0_09420 [Caldisphaera sp.]
MIIATLLPFYRIHEINEYFIKNSNLINAKEKIIYVDNVYNEKQYSLLRQLFDGLEIKVGNWRSIGGAYLSILEDIQNFNETLVIDSDNLLDEDFLVVHNNIKGDIYTITEHSSWNSKNNMERSRKIGSINSGNFERPLMAYKVYSPKLRQLGSNFSIGPKQAVIFRKPIDLEILMNVKAAFDDVPAELRSFISDESLLGIIVYLSGYKEIPWTVATTHVHHGSLPAASRIRKVLVAEAYYRFAKSLQRHLKEYKIDKELMRFKLRYEMLLIKNLKTMF